MTIEKYVLNVKELHFGHIKETFRAGAVIEKPEGKNELIIDGRTFSDTRDLDILKSQAAKNPSSPWILPWTEKNAYLVARSFPVNRTLSEQASGRLAMKVVQSDTDERGGEIDIRETQVGKRAKEAREEARQDASKVNGKDMPVVPAYQDSQQRLAELRGKTDVSSIAERVEIKTSGPASMPVVQDDSLGNVSQKATPMNVGQKLPSRAEVDANVAKAKSIAEARKNATSEAKTKTGRPRGRPPKEKVKTDVLPVDVSTDASLAKAIGASEAIIAEPEPVKPSRTPQMPVDVSTPEKLNAAIGE